MPIYEYECKKCGHQFEMLVGFNEKEKDLACPECSTKNPEKLFSAFASFGGSSVSSAPAHGHTCSLGGGG